MLVTLKKYFKYADPTILTGPIFEKELRVSSRRKRNYIFRSFYLIALTLVVSLFWATIVSQNSGGPLAFTWSMVDWRPADPELVVEIGAFLDGEPLNDAVVTPFYAEGNLLFFVLSVDDIDRVPGDSRPGWPIPIRSAIERLAADLSPMRRMAEAGGPTNVNPCCSQRAANRKFSARKP